MVESCRLAGPGGLRNPIGRQRAANRKISGFNGCQHCRVACEIAARTHLAVVSARLVLMLNAIIRISAIACVDRGEIGSGFKILMMVVGGSGGYMGFMVVSPRTADVSGCSGRKKLGRGGYDNERQQYGDQSPGNHSSGRCPKSSHV